MIIDQDLDIRNYAKALDDNESLIYIRSDNDNVVHVVVGDVLDIANILIDMDELQDIILNVAAHIVKENSLDFNEILDGTGDN